MATLSTRRPKTTLLGLPAEIRNEIFRLAVISSTPFFASMAHSKRIPYPLPPNLARVSRQARREAIPIFYGANPFKFEQQHQAEDWSELLSAHISGAAEHLTKIIISNCFCASHLRQRYPNAMDMLLSLDSNRLLSIDYLGMFRRRFCTCESEEQARKIIRQPNVPLSRALVWFAANISKFRDRFRCQYHLGEFKWRTASCGCGSQERRLKDIQTLRSN